MSETSPWKRHELYCKVLSLISRLSLSSWDLAKTQPYLAPASTQLFLRLSAVCPLVASPYPSLFPWQPLPPSRPSSLTQSPSRSPVLPVCDLLAPSSTVAVHGATTGISGERGTTKHAQDLAAGLLGTQHQPLPRWKLLPHAVSPFWGRGWGEATATTSGDLIASWHYDVTGLAF